MPGTSATLRIGAIFTNAARATPSRTMAVLEDASINFAEYEAASNRLAHTLLALEIGLGRRVATSIETSIDLLVLFGALAKVGAVFVPCNPGLSHDELRPLLDYANPFALIVDRIRHQPLSGVFTKMFVLDDLVARSADQPSTPPTCPQPAESDPHVIFFTSGSSGRPKGAVLSHRLNMLRSHPGALPLPRGMTVCPYPLFHMSAWTISLQCWQARDAIVIVRGGDPAAICEAITKHKATQINTIPAVWQRILDYAHNHQDVDLTSLQVVDTGTSATPLDLLDAIAAGAPNARLRVFYGSTEAGSVACLEHEDVATRPGSCGQPTIYTELRLSEETELLVRGALVFSGYFNDPEANEAAFEGEWYRTGDLARVDEDGFVTITGRAGNLIRSGGEGVVPSEVEAVLGDHSKAADVAVIGIPHPRWGEVVCAVVVERDSQPLTLEELRAHCEGRLASYKHPRALWRTDRIPRTPATNQIQRKILVAQAIDALVEIEGLN